ncbi:MAG: hypothetical protein WKF84_28915 [Pyrinomonadaceae bacterium]
MITKDRHSALMNASSPRVSLKNLIDGYFGFYPTMDSEDNGPLLTVEREGSFSWVMRVSTDEAPLFLFPDDFDPEIFQQFRFRKLQGELSIQWEIQSVGIVPCPPGSTRVGLFCARASSAAFDTAQ